MSTKFEGTLAAGEAVVIHCADVWLKGVVLKPFRAEPGSSALLTLRLTEVVDGSSAFPPAHSFGELSVNTNSWDIFRAEGLKAVSLALLVPYSQ
jgi:hypothetical protein